MCRACATLAQFCAFFVGQAVALHQRLSARGSDRHVAEFQVRVAILNGFTALGILVTEAIG